jgi:hypothetical protein
MRTLILAMAVASTACFGLSHLAYGQSCADSMQANMQQMASNAVQLASLPT